jgi:hypothetical protein
MFVRQFVGLVEREEELRGIGIPLSTICHSDQSSPTYQLPSFFHTMAWNLPVEPKPAVLLILEGLAVETFSAESRPGRISRLDNEVGNQAVKDDIVVVPCQ